MCTRVVRGMGVHMCMGVHTCDSLVTGNKVVWTASQC